MPWWLTSPEGSAGAPTTEIRGEDRSILNSITMEFAKENSLWSETIGLSTGHRLPTPDEPFQLRITSSHQVLTDDFLNGRIGRVISERVVDAIERMEPNIHGYWSVDVNFRDGSYAGRRWFLNIGNRLHTLDLENSKVKGNKEAFDGNISPDFTLVGSRPLLRGPEVLTCRRDAVGNHAIWCEYRFQKAIFVSEKFHEVLTKFDPPLKGGDFYLQTGLR